MTEATKKEVLCDERTQGIQSRNIRWNWILLNYALAGIIFYRSAVLRQEFAQFADVFFVWMGANLLYAVLDLATGGLTPAAFRVSAVPAIIAGLVAGAGVTVLATDWNPWLVALVAFILASAVVVGFALARRRNRRA